MSKEIIIISLGGSLIIPKEINIEFLKKFRELILAKIKDKRFIIIVGGGKICREYQSAASNVVKIDKEDLDWLGVHSTRLNAHLLRTIFRDNAYPRIIKDPTEKIDFKEEILIAAGWKPGWSTDYDSVLLAKNFKIKTIINLTNVDYAYDKDPNKFKDAKIIKEVSWNNFLKIIGSEWNPGDNFPFDPIATKEASKLGLKVIIANGNDINNFNSILDGKNFKGTIIS